MIVLVFINDLWIGKAECSGGCVPILSQPSADHDARQQEEACCAALHTEKAIVMLLLSLLLFVCLCTWHCVPVLRHGTTKLSSIAMLLVFKPTCWCYLGIEMGLEIMLVLCCLLNITCGNRTAKWFLQMTQRTLSFSFMMKISLLIMVTLRTGISVFTRINFHGSKIIKILLQL